jgi:hypothetical protein
VYEQSKVIDQLYTNRAAFVSSQVHELETSINQATNERLRAAFEEELALYRDGYNYVGNWSGWPMVLLWTPPIQNDAPSQCVVVCRSEQRKVDILLLLRTDHEVASYSTVIAIVRGATQRMDSMTSREWAAMPKRRGPLFDGTGTLVDETVSRAVGFTQFLQQR